MPTPSSSAVRPLSLPLALGPRLVALELVLTLLAVPLLPLLPPRSTALLPHPHSHSRPSSPHAHPQPRAQRAASRSSSRARKAPSALATSTAAPSAAGYAASMPGGARRQGCRLCSACETGRASSSRRRLRRVVELVRLAGVERRSYRCLFLAFEKGLLSKSESESASLVVAGSGKARRAAASRPPRARCG